MAATHALYDVDPYAITITKKGANRQRIFLKKAAEAVDVTLPAEHVLLKDAPGGGDWSVFYCVVAEPGAEEDGGLGADGVVDVWKDEDEIRRAAHRFAKNRGYVNAMHGALEEQGCTVVENAIALSDFTVGDETIRKGSWYLAIEPTPDFKALVDSGEITGVSLEGTGMREVLTKRQFTAAERRKAPTADGDSFPIETVQDLKNAIRAFGRAKNKAKVKAHIIARAKALGATSLLPDDWKVGKDTYDGAKKCPSCKGKVAQDAAKCQNCGHSFVQKAATMAHERTIGSKGKNLFGIPGAQLPAYIQHVYNDLVQKGRPPGGATYRLAVGIVKNWAAGHDGKGGKVNADTQAKAQKAIAEWERLKARARADNVKKEHAVDESKWRRLGIALGFVAKTDDDDDESLTDDERRLLEAFPSDPGTVVSKNEEDDVDEQTQKRIEAIEKSAEETRGAIASLTDLVEKLVAHSTKQHERKDEEEPDAAKLKKALESLSDEQGKVTVALAKIAEDVEKLATGASAQHRDAETVRKTEEPWFAGVL